MKCPNCKRKVSIKKYELYNCVCGRVIMLIEINKAKLLVDVTPGRRVKKIE